MDSNYNNTAKLSFHTGFPGWTKAKGEDETLADGQETWTSGKS